MKILKSFFLALRPLVFVIFVAFMFASCKYDLQRLFFRDPSPDKRSADLEQIQTPVVVSNPIDFMIVTDLHFGKEKPKAQEEFFASLENRKLDFIVFLGDVVDSGDSENFEEAEQFVQRLKTHLGSEFPVPPIYVVLGNHDLYNDGYEEWTKLNFNAAEGATFYKFETISVVGDKKYPRSWYVLDTASGILGTRQLEELRESMNEDPNPKVVFSHYPVYTDMNLIMFFKLSDDRERATLIDIFDKNDVDMIFSGHYHPGGFFDYGSFFELCCQSFVENSEEDSSWFFLVLDEANRTLSVEKHSVSSSGEYSQTISDMDLT